MSNILGNKYGLLTVKSLHSTDNKGREYYACECECGNTCIAQLTHLTTGNTKSCGCYRKQVAKSRFTTHGCSSHSLHGIWNMMKQRCYNKNNCSYPNYGGKGIRVCDNWFYDFNNFFTWAINNGYKQGLTLDRKRVGGDYEPSNCRWVGQTEQQNNRSNNIHITYRGVTLGLAQWADKLGIKYATLYKRIVINKWDPAKAFTTDVKIYNRKNRCATDE